MICICQPNAFQEAICYTNDGFRCETAANAPYCIKPGSDLREQISHHGRRDAYPRLMSHSSAIASGRSSSSFSMMAAGGCMALNSLAICSWRPRMFPIDLKCRR